MWVFGALLLFVFVSGCRAAAGGHEPSLPSLATDHEHGTLAAAASESPNGNRAPPPDPDVAPSPPAPLTPPSPQGYKNVLFIVVDDLRPEISAYGHHYMKTPHLDKLASEGTVYTRAYVQYSFCAPSRNSFMTGRRPDATKAWNFLDHFREEGIGDKWKTMPQWFRENGFFTVGSGKLFHPALPPNFDVPHSWQRMYYPGCNTGEKMNGWDVADPNVTTLTCLAQSGCEAQAIVAGDSDPANQTWCSLNTSLLKNPLGDDLVLSSGIKLLQEAAENLKGPTPRPFFVGVGFHKPHLPWNFPFEFGDLYDVEDIQPPKYPNPPKGMPLVAWHESGGYFKTSNNTGYLEFHNRWAEPCPANDTRYTRRAYYASVSYTDSNIGKLLVELDRLDLASTTLVTVMGDHGWSLGENNMWQKMTNFELGVRVPLIMRAPWLPKSVGAVTHALVEAVDLFPTFTVLAGLQEARPLPPDQLLQGSSLANVLADPNDRSNWKPYAFSQFAKASQHSSELNQSVPWNVCILCNRTTIVSNTTVAENTIGFMGFSARGDNFRYTEWFRWDPINEVPFWNITEGVELYNHTGDYGQDFDLSTPTQNLAHMPNLHLLQARFRAALLKQFQGDHEPPQRAAE